MNSVFEVDRKGLAQVLARRGKEFILLELIQNAFDEDGVSSVLVGLDHVPGTRRHRLHVVDNAPRGFENLDESYVLFAPSKKKGDPTKRGRFNVGEKMVLALCEDATITTVSGSIHFNLAKGTRRKMATPRTEEGTIFSAELIMQKHEAKSALELARHIIVPEGVRLLVEDTHVGPRKRLATVTVGLPTDVMDLDGNMCRTTRNTKVHIYEPMGDPQLYEMGLPVVEFDCPWDVNIEQKIPLNIERDGVTPAYGRKIKTLVLNAMKDVIDPEDAKAPWVGEALRDPRVDHAAVEAIITARYGDKRVIADPSDPEGTKLAVSEGYTVIPAGSFDKAQWAAVKASGAALPAGQVTPSPRPYSDQGAPLKLLEREKWTNWMRNIEAYATVLAEHLLGASIQVQVACDMGLGAAATFGPSGVLTLNLARLGHDWFGPLPDEAVDRLLIHEFAHYTQSDHLSSGYHRELCNLAAKMTSLALSDPGLFRARGRSG